MPSSASESNKLEPESIRALQNQNELVRMKKRAPKSILALQIEFDSNGLNSEESDSNLLESDSIRVQWIGSGAFLFNLMEPKSTRGHRYPI